MKLNISNCHQSNGTYMRHILYRDFHQSSESILENIYKFHSHIPRNDSNICMIRFTSHLHLRQYLLSTFTGYSGKHSHRWVVKLHQTWNRI
ncbi:hypothetical protein BLOT_016305 [Blomia tropicalis]|nr:hypothetical protein BLOT_016305 [Blomia tropicalis]